MTLMIIDERNSMMRVSLKSSFFSMCLIGFCLVAADEVSAECLRSIDVEDLLDAMPSEWRPTTPDLPAPVGTNGMPTPHQWLVLDGDLLRNHPSEVWEKWESEGSPLQIVIGKHLLNLK